MFYVELMIEDHNCVVLEQLWNNGTDVLLFWNNPGTMMSVAHK